MKSLRSAKPGKDRKRPAASRKLARKKAQREGLLPPDPRKKKLLDAKKPGQRPLRPFP
jgi:hypothetical protein